MTADAKHLQDHHPEDRHGVQVCRRCRQEWPCSAERGRQAAREGVEELRDAIQRGKFDVSTPSGFTERRSGRLTTLDEALAVSDAAAGLREALESLRKRPCENYEAPQDCITAGPQVLAAEGCGPCVARASQAPRKALEALADEWTYKGEHGWGPWQAGEGPSPEGWVLDHAATTLRAVLAAHPAPEPAAVALEQEVARLTERLGPCSCNDGPSSDGPSEFCPHHGRTHDEWIERIDLAEARVAELEAEVERWTEKAQEAGKAYADANTKHHEELDRANRLEGMADRLSERCVGLLVEVERWKVATEHNHAAAQKAEARARRAVDALRAVRVEVAATRRRLLKSIEDAIDNDPVVALVVGPHVTNIMDAFCERLDRALSGTRERRDATPSDTTTEEDA